MKFPPLRLRSALSLGGMTPRELAVKTWKAMDDHEIQTRAAAVSFYAMLAMVPFIGLVLAFAVQLLPDLTGASEQAKGLGNMTVEQLTSTLEKTLPPEASAEIKDQIARLQKDPPFGLISIGLVVTIWLASSLFVAVIDAMNRIYGVKERRGFIKLRLIAILMTVVQAAILVGSLLAIVGSNWIFNHMGLGASWAWLGSAALYFTVFVMVLMSFALCVLRRPRRGPVVGNGSRRAASSAALLFLGATFLFRIYVHNFANYDKTYGPLGGVMVLLFWFWISSLILLGRRPGEQDHRGSLPPGQELRTADESKRSTRLRRHDAPARQPLKPSGLRPPGLQARPEGLLDRGRRTRSGSALASRVVSSETSAGLGSGKLGLVSTASTAWPGPGRGPRLAGGTSHQARSRLIRSRAADVESGRSGRTLGEPDQRDGRRRDRSSGVRYSSSKNDREALPPRKARIAWSKK